MFLLLPSEQLLIRNGRFLLLRCDKTNQSVKVELLLYSEVCLDMWSLKLFISKLSKSENIAIIIITIIIIIIMITIILINQKIYMPPI